MDLQPDTLLNNRYQILRKLGQGGMGAVYLAKDTRLNLNVALKVNRNQATEATTQFLKEARLLATLNHPNLPRVTDYFILEQNQCLVMDYIPGDDLDKIVKEGGAQPVDRVLNWAHQLSQALSYLHQQVPPVIHRDIKPGNLKLTPTGTIVLVDFGIAKAAEQTANTATGAVGYSPGYAPPEQYGIARTGPYSDQYSFAATLYALLSGERPVESVQRVLGYAVLTPLNVLNPAVPAHVQAAIERAMNVRPDERFASIEEFAFALEHPEAMQASPTGFPETTLPKDNAELERQPAITDGGTVRISPGRTASAQRTAGAVSRDQAQSGISSQKETAPAKKQKGWLWALAGILGVGAILVGLVVIVLVVIRPFDIPAMVSASPTPFTTPTFTPIFPSATPVPPTATPTSVPPTPTLTPSQIAATVTIPAVIPTTTFTPAPTKPPLGNGGWIAYSSNREDPAIQQIWLMSVELNDAGQVVAKQNKQLTSGTGDKRHPAWSPNGKFLLYVAPGGKNEKGEDLGDDIWRIGVDGSNPINLTKAKGNDREPAWSPDGKWIAYTNDSHPTGVRMVFLLNAADPTERIQLTTDQNEYSPTWDPDMNRLAYVVFVGTGELFWREKTEKGYTKFVRFRSTGNYPDIPDDLTHPSWSPDGKRIAITRLKKDGTKSIQTITLGGKIDTLTTSGQDDDPAWSPDSQWIVFTSKRNNNNDIFIMRSTGIGQVNLTQSAANDVEPAWQPFIGTP
ncbi:MAG TPA: protein kinase [Anaerolineaceae bacterium]